MLATVGAVGLTSMIAASRVMPAEPIAETDQRDGDRQAGGDDGAEGQDQQHQGDDDADELAATLHRGGRGAGQLAAEGDLVAGVLRRGGGVLEGRHVAHQVLVGDRARRRRR